MEPVTSYDTHSSSRSIRWRLRKIFLLRGRRRCNGGNRPGKCYWPEEKRRCFCEPRDRHSAASLCLHDIGAYVILLCRERRHCTGSQVIIFPNGELLFPGTRSCCPSGYLHVPRSFTVNEYGAMIFRLFSSYVLKYSASRRCSSARDLESSGILNSSFFRSL
jgi:hypothetical protein